MVEASPTGGRYTTVISVSLQNALAELDSAIADLVAVQSAGQPAGPAVPGRRELEATACKRVRTAYKTFIELVIYRGAVDRQEQEAVEVAFGRALELIRDDDRYRTSVREKLDEVRDKSRLERYTKPFSLNDPDPDGD